jgi:YjjG family noncanonical pyrimidine nucleotidase
MRYTTLLFDLDHTLFDFDTSEAEAFTAALSAAGIEVSDRTHERFVAINRALWRRVEAGELTPNDLRVVRFERLFDEVGVVANARQVADDYLIGLGAYGDLYPGARDLLSDLAEVASLALVSNGIGQVVRDKVKRLDLDPYFAAIVISGEVGVAKPHSGFFDVAFERLDHPDKSTTLMIGDSLASDVKGGADYGIDTCWYTPDTETVPTLEPTHRIASLSELPGIVNG